MPGISGEEACRRIKATPTCRDIPVLILTAHKDQEALLSCLKAGADDYIPKSDEFDVLKGRVRAQLRRKQYEGENRLIQEVVATLRKSEALLGGLFEFAPDAIVVSDCNGRIVRINAQAEAAFCYSRAEVLNQPVELLLPERYRQQHESFRQSLFAQPQRRALGLDRELSARRKDGSEFPVDIMLGPVQTEEGLLMLATIRDITERKRAEKAIVSYNHRLEILRQIDRALIAGDEPKSIAGAVLPLLRDLLGVGRVVVNLFDLVTGEVEWLAAAGRRRVHVGPGVRYSIRFMGDVEALKRGEPQLIDVHTLPAGSEVDALLASGVDSYMVVPMIVDAELIGALSFGGASKPFSSEQIGIAQEVATQFAIALTQAQMKLALLGKNEELREISRQLWQTAKLATMGELAASVAHELNNPLATINLHLESLLDESPPSSRSAQRLTVIEQEVDRMAQLVANLLQFSRPGQQQISSLDVHEELEKTLEIIHYVFRKNNIAINRDYTAELPMIHADRQKLRQVFLNLLVNACDAMPAGGAVTLRTKSDMLPEGKRCVSIEIIDSGIGIKPEDLERVMESFFTTKPEGKGTGLGLAICRRIVQEHHGTIGLTSKIDQGTTVRILLPIANGTNGKIASA